MVLLPFFGFIRFHDYPVWRPEVLLVVGAILALGAPFGLLISIRAKTLGAAAITALLLAWLGGTILASNQDMFFVVESARHWLVNIAGSAGMYIVFFGGFALVVGTIFFLASRLGQYLGIVVATAFGMASVSVLIAPTGKIFLGEFYRNPAIAQADLPPIVHFILDEHIGLQGLPSDIEGADELRNELIAFYESFGFRVFGRAYSQYADTKVSLAAMLSGQPHNYITSGEDAEASRTHLSQNPWFEHLAEQGYRVRVYSSYDVNFCGKDESPIHSCFGYSANSISSLKDSNLPAVILAKAISASFLDTVILYRMWLDTSPNVVRQGAVLPNWLRQEHKFAAPASLPVLRQVLQDLHREPRGSAYFVHLLIPHHTYLYDQDCRIRSDIESWANHVSPDADFASGQINTPDSRKRSYATYLEQLRCTKSQLRAFFEDLRAIGTFEDGTIIVHGDHGSRIAKVPANGRFADRLSNSDLVDLFSVLFAVHGPGIESGYDNRLRSLQSLFAEIALQHAQSPEPDDIVLSFINEFGDPIPGKTWLRMPMPNFGAALSAAPEDGEAPIN